MMKEEPATGTAIRVEQVSVSYGLNRVVDNVSLTLESGQSLALLGLNGAGKTTLVRSILGLRKVREGQVRVFDRRPGTLEVFGRLGYAPEEAILPEFLTVQEYLDFAARMRIKDHALRNEEVRKLLEWFELDPRKKVSDASKGMKRRLVLAQAFVGAPALMILDEPLNGLDPIMIMRLRERLVERAKNGGTLLYASHILAEVEKNCTHVAILSKGKLSYCETLSVVLERYGSVESAFAEHVK